MRECHRPLSTPVRDAGRERRARIVGLKETLSLATGTDKETGAATGPAGGRRRWS
jgi:hypothetical protein